MRRADQNEIRSLIEFASIHGEEVLFDAIKRMNIDMVRTIMDINDKLKEMGSIVDVQGVGQVPIMQPLSLPES